MSILQKLVNNKRLTKNDLKKPFVADDKLKYITGKPFGDFFPVQSMIEPGIFLNRDLSTVIGIVKIKPLSIEAISGEAKTETFEKLSTALSQAIITEYSTPWLSQFFIINNQNSAVEDIMYRLKKHSKCNNQYTDYYFKEAKKHLKDISNPDGAFIDHNTDLAWSVTKRDIYFCLWQEINNDKKQKEYEIANRQYKKTKDTLDKLKRGLAQVDIKVETIDEQEYIDLASNFITGKKINYKPKIEEDLSCIALGGKATKISVDNNGIFKFNDTYRVYLALESLGDIKLGHLSVENKTGVALLDSVHNDCIWTQITIHIHSDKSNEILNRIIKASLGQDPSVSINKKQAVEAQEQIAKGDYVFRFTGGVYVCANKLHELENKTRDIKTILSANQIKLLDTKENPLAAQDYLDSLPGAFNAEKDNKFYNKRTTLQYYSDINKIAPFYGRSTGTQNSSILLYNRGGEALMFDPIADRVKNAFGFIFGPMGSGKSAFSIYFLMQLLATYNPRIFIIEKGDSFGLFVQHCKSLGLSTNRISIKANNKDVSITPFADATKLLKQKISINKSISDIKTNNNDTDIDDDGLNRDILGEMLIKAHIMVTGGDINEEKYFRRADLTILAQAIVLAAENTKKDNREITITEDVVQALDELSNDKALSGNKKERILAIKDAINTFILSDFDKQIFNTAGRLFPKVDITQLDVGILGNEGYQDKLAVAFISLMTNINTIVEDEQFNNRPTIILVDEAHLITTNALLAPYIVKISKMWRKLGAWLWLVTQNLDDFTDSAKSMLDNMEWWICLNLSKNDVSKLKKFKNITPEQEQMLLSAKKSTAQYIEGGILSDNMECLFKNIPPAIAYALAMTEKDEKALRQTIMNEHNCSELEAAQMIAEDISKKRRCQ